MIIIRAHHDKVTSLLATSIEADYFSSSSWTKSNGSKKKRNNDNSNTGGGGVEERKRRRKRLLVSGSADYTVKIWDLSAATAIASRELQRRQKRQQQRQLQQQETSETKKKSIRPSFLEGVWICDSLKHMMITVTVTIITIIIT